MVGIINSLLSIFTVVGLAGIVIAFIAFVYSKKKSTFIESYSLKISFLTVFLATLASLYYSDVVGYEPCRLCWYQRIFLYPQVILFPIAFWKKDKTITIYSMALSGIGAVIAGYQSLLQMGLVPNLPCSAALISCSQRFVFTYGFITIPLMAFTAFALIFILMLLKYKSDNQK